MFETPLRSDIEYNGFLRFDVYNPFNEREGRKGTVDGKDKSKVESELMDE